MAITLVSSPFHTGRDFVVVVFVFLREGGGSGILFDQAGGEYFFRP